jgi:hypothetical protein
MGGSDDATNPLSKSESKACKEKKTFPRIRSLNHRLKDENKIYSNDYYLSMSSLSSYNSHSKPLNHEILIQLLHGYEMNF